MSCDALLVREDVFHVREGRLVGAASWVYAWVRAGDPAELLYVGATGFPPMERTRLHLEHEDPDIGRIRAHHPAALSGDVRVHAFLLRAGIERHEVKRALLARLGGAATTGDGAEGRAAAQIAARLRALGVSDGA